MVISYRDTQKKIGSTVFRLRTERNLTQMTFAERARMEQPTISDIECGKIMPGLHNARKIASGFGMTLSELMKEAEL